MKKTYKRHCQLADDILALAYRANICFSVPTLIFSKTYWEIGGVKFSPILDNQRMEKIICEYTGELIEDYRFEADANMNLRRILRLKPIFSLWWRWRMFSFRLAMQILKKLKIRN